MARKKKVVKEKILSIQELKDLESSHCQQQISEVKLRSEKILLDKLKTDLELLQAKFKLKNVDVEKQVQKVEAVKKELERNKEKGKELTNKIKEEYDLNERWGFDPLTGEIKDE
jgi:hypothetical protein